ncbi:trypsin-like peptidase domain-containing protein [Haliangium sp.]|uniref:S1C family serine protease n=1 Tax=Haliangium sp. TaxID=2663208 RepID=UPI003D0A188B
MQKLSAQLELASSFAERQKLVVAAAQEASPDELKQIARLLNHKIEAVRLGAIQIFEKARFRPVLRILADATSKRGGQERVFAARAVASMAEPVDRDWLEPIARAWLAEKDEFLRLHGDSLLVALGVPAAAGSGDTATKAAIVPAAQAPAPAPTPSGLPGEGITAVDREARARAIAHLLAQDDPAPMLCTALIETKHPGVRMDLVGALEALGPTRLAEAAPVLLSRGDGDLVALVARALERAVPNLGERALTPLRAVLREARGRLRGHALARAALDDCALEVEADDAIEGMAERVDEVSIETVRRVAAHLEALPGDRRLRFIPKLLEALGRKPRRVLLFAAVLREAWASLRPPRRRELLGILHAAGRARIPSGLGRDELISVAHLYAAVLGPGDAPPATVLDALDRRDEPEVAVAAIEVHRSLATEEAAERLAEYVEEPTVEVRDAARRALIEMKVRHVDIAVGDDGSVAITPAYRTPAGEPLRAGEGVLATDDGVRYALDGDGDPVAEKDTEWGGCRCCKRPRVLIRARGARPTCPRTGLAHLREGERACLERDHPLGGCGVCESVVPLVRAGAVVRCSECGTEHVRVDQRYRPAPRVRSRGAGSSVGVGAGVKPQAGLTLPAPPSPDELKLVEPSIAQAMAANVFLIGGAGDKGWFGSGVIVARAGAQVAVLTNRHVVEDEVDPNHAIVADMRAVTITGEVASAQVVWRAERGLDLALITLTLDQPERVGLAPLQEGACLVGSRLFAIGNPLGLSWSYSSGTVAAFRTDETAQGLPVRYIQSHVAISYGSSGGGLYHEDGHLVGINQRGIDAPGGAQNFAIAMPTVVDALRREQVGFAGAPLAP